MNAINFLKMANMQPTENKVTFSREQTQTERGSSFLTLLGQALTDKSVETSPIATDEESDLANLHNILTAAIEELSFSDTLIDEEMLSIPFVEEFMAELPLELQQEIEQIFANFNSLQELVETGEDYIQNPAELLAIVITLAQTEVKHQDETQSKEQVKNQTQQVEVQTQYKLQDQVENQVQTHGKDKTQDNVEVQTQYKLQGQVENQVQTHGNDKTQGNVEVQTQYKLQDRVENQVQTHGIDKTKVNEEVQRQASTNKEFIEAEVNNLRETFVKGATKVEVKQQEDSRIHDNVKNVLTQKVEVNGQIQVQSPQNELERLASRLHLQLEKLLSTLVGTGNKKMTVEKGLFTSLDNKVSYLFQGKEFVSNFIQSIQYLKTNLQMMSAEEKANFGKIFIGQSQNSSEELIVLSGSLKGSSDKLPLTSIGMGLPNMGLQLHSVHQFMLHVGEGRSDGQSAEQFLRQFQNILGKSSLMQFPNGVNQLSIKLFPENLGRLDVRLTEQNGVIVAQLMTTTKAAKSAIESQLHQLKQAFIAQNIQVEKIEINIQQPQQQSLNQSDKQNQQNQNQKEEATNQQTENEEREEEIRFDDFLDDTFNTKV